MYNTSFMNLFNELLGEQVNFVESSNDSNKPLANILETDESYKIELATPGLNKEITKINATVKDNKLKIKAETKSNEINYHIREFNYDNFELFFDLPKYIDKKHITFYYENGVIYITINKTDKGKDINYEIKL